MRTSALSFVLLFLAAFAATSVTAQNTNATSATSASISTASASSAASSTSTTTPTVNLALSSFLASYTAAPATTSNPYSALTACCGDYFNTLELCINALNAGNSTLNAVSVQLYECACAQGQTFYSAMSSCLNCVGTNAAVTTTSNTVQQACQNLTANHNSFPTFGGNYPLSALQALPSPTGSLAVTAWPGHGAGEKVVAQIMMAVGMVVASVAVMLL